MLWFSSSQKRILRPCLAFHNVCVPQKGRGRSRRKRDKLERSHFFSIIIARLQGHHSQWVVHGDAPSRNTLIMGCWHVSRRELAIGGWEAGVRLSTSQIQKREYPGRGWSAGDTNNYHHQEQLQQHRSWAPVVPLFTKRQFLLCRHPY